MPRIITLLILLLFTNSLQAQTKSPAIAGRWIIDSSVCKSPQGMHKFDDIAKSQTWTFTADGNMLVAEAGLQPENSGAYKLTVKDNKTFVTTTNNGKGDPPMEIVSCTGKHLALKSDYPEISFTLYFTRVSGK